MFRHINEAGDVCTTDENNRKRHLSRCKAEKTDKNSENNLKAKKLNIEPDDINSYLPENNWTLSFHDFKAENLSTPAPFENCGDPKNSNKKRPFIETIIQNSGKRKRRKSLKITKGTRNREENNAVKKVQKEKKLSQTSKLTTCLSLEPLNKFYFPPEIMLRIFQEIPHKNLINLLGVCQYWKDLILDVSLWNKVKNFKLIGKNPSTENAKIILGHARSLQLLHVCRRNDLDQLLDMDPDEKTKLRSIVIEHCSGWHFHKRLSLLIENCPKLRSLTIKYTALFEPSFYKTLAQNHSKFESVQITCAGRKDMAAFVTSLKKVSPEASFRESSMRGRIENKRISWRPILGFQITSKPTTYPSYMF